MIVGARPFSGINDLAKKISDQAGEDAANEVLAAGRVLSTIIAGDGHSIEINQGLCYCKGGTSFECPEERDINRASKAQLAAIPGSDDDLADLILEHRGDVGYKTVAEAWKRLAMVHDSKSHLKMRWRDGLCTDGTYSGCPYTLLDGQCCDEDKVVQGQCTDGKSTAAQTTSPIDNAPTTTSSIDTAPTTSSIDTAPTTTSPIDTAPTTSSINTPYTEPTTNPPTTSTTMPATIPITTKMAAPTTTAMKKTCQVESSDDGDMWSGSWHQSGDSVVISMTATKPTPSPGHPQYKYWVAIGFSAINNDTWPATMEVYMGEVRVSLHLILWLLSSIPSLWGVKQNE